MDRGASSVVGTILMTGIVITAMTVAGVAMLDRTYGGAERAPVGAVDVTTHDGTVAVTYCGGEPLASDGLVVVLRGADETRRVGFSEGEWATGGGATGSFSPGMTWRFENATVGALAEDDVAVVHRPSNSVLDTTKCGGPETTPATSTSTTSTTTTTTTTTTTSTPTTTTSTTGDDSTPTVFLDVTLVDKSGPNDRAAYDVQYALNASEAARTANVSVTIRDETTDDIQSYTDLAATAGTHRVSYDSGGATGDPYAITVRAYDASGGVIGTSTVTDVADGIDSDGNGTVERTGEPLRNITLVDRTGPDDGAAYTVGYEAADAVANVTVALMSTANESRVSQTATLSATNGCVTYHRSDSAGSGNRYVISLAARNTSGSVIDEYVLQDVADGRDTRDGFDPAERDAVQSVTLVDRSTQSGGTQYTVSYETGGPAVDRVAVAFVDHEKGSASETRIYPGSGSATYEKYTYGDNYTIVVAALDADGRVLDVQTLTDIADGEDGRDLGEVSRPGKPIRHLSVDDQSGGHYVVEATAGSTADRIEAMVMQNGSVAKSWANATDGFDYYGSGGKRYAFTFLAYDADGNVVDAYVVTDVANGRDSAESYDTDRAVVSRVVVTDKSGKQSGKKSRYRVDYASNASRVDVVFHHPTNAYYGMEANLALAPSGRATYPPSGSKYFTSGDNYVIVVRALNDDGEVVDVVAVQDEADGTDPPPYTY